MEKIKLALIGLYIIPYLILLLVAYVLFFIVGQGRLIWDNMYEESKDWLVISFSAIMWFLSIIYVSFIYYM